MNANDEAIIRAFITPARRTRWLESLASPKRRAAMLDRLNHCRDLDERYATLLSSHTDVVALLLSRGAPSTCYVLSCIEAVDGRTMPLDEAVFEAELGGWGTIISCIPGRLAYYYDECGERRMILERAAPGLVIELRLVVCIRTGSGREPMWTTRTENLASRRTNRIAIDHDTSPVSYAEVLDRWQHDAEFRSFFINLLADSPFAAFRWETPPFTTATSNRPFEFVLLDSPGLARPPDAGAFAEHFDAASQGGVVEFPNLGGDAIMVVPCPVGPLTAYGHLAAFMREAPEVQKHALWEAVGAAMQRRLSAETVWLSTAGAGVAWLHVRLDDRPKYYGHAPYRETA